MLRRYYGRNLRTVVGASDAPYGYTVTTWTSGALLIHAQGLPDILQVMLFIIGAVVGYALVSVIAFGGLGSRLKEQPRNSALWGNLHFFSIGFAIGASCLSSHLIQDILAWPTTGFLATVVYLLVLGLEFAAADERTPEE